ncbi:reverse transcriptase family protein [Microbacterium horticulturae]|uniref:RNA-directed DNA polymerase n=1 Tax=Microbacterium horticulturae TaxID=3028316 RepID=A0ABY8C0Q4_9MICO|nr:reverse transcriptase family protein [Microbacterium sp. KACC 23027]WEG08917.1 reverse transcriptase family protein [Microbacterium sp. KACC 23027]
MLVDRVEAGEGYVRYVQSKNGKRRLITFVTDEQLRRVHGRILDLLTPLGEDLPENVHAFVRGRSIRSNALQHTGAVFTQTFDLADFFTQVKRSMVVDGLTHFGVVSEIARVLADLTTVAGSLPMGFMTSPMLANTSLHRFDADLLALASGQGLTVSRYADDIVFSGAEAFDVTDTFNQVAGQHQLQVNHSKSRSSRRGQRMVVTGLSIATGDRPRLPRTFRAKIRQELHYITAYGLEGHADHLRPKAMSAGGLAAGSPMRNQSTASGSRQSQRDIRKPTRRSPCPDRPDQ